MPQTTKTFQPATNITETYNAVNPEQPLQPGDPRYVDCAPWRGDEHIVNMIARRIIRANAAAPVQHLKQLLAGHRGCGKSTELLYHLIVLEYQNGERWADLHPAVQETRKFRTAWENEEKTTRQKPSAKTGRQAKR
jgi:hypothetical protein